MDVMYPNSWMVSFMENPIRMPWILGYPHGFEASIYFSSSWEIPVLCFTDL